MKRNKSIFFDQLKIPHPKSAILSLIECHPCPNPSPQKVKRLPSLLTSLFNRMNKGLDDAKLANACQSAFDALAITTEEADYLEHSTRLQARSSVWFDYRKGRITASKFSQTVVPTHLPICFNAEGCNKVTNTSSSSSEVGCRS